MDLFGSAKIKEQEQQLRKNIEVITRLENELQEAKNERDARRSVIYLLNEKTPENVNERKTYMADITTFYRKIFKSKIDHMISAQKDALSILGRTVLEYDLFRSNINVLFLIDDWMSQCEREHLSDIGEARQKAEDSLGIISEMEGKYQ